MPYNSISRKRLTGYCQRAKKAVTPQLRRGSASFIPHYKKGRSEGFSQPLIGLNTHNAQAINKKEPPAPRQTPLLFNILMDSNKNQGASASTLAKSAVKASRSSLPSCSFK